MKKAIIGALVGAILVFGWQAIAHVAMHHHDAAYKNIPNEANVLSALTGALKEEGQYLVPGINPNATQEEEERYMKESAGKPWALITYHPIYDNNMGMAAFRSFVTAFFCVLLFIWIMGKDHGNFSTVLLKSLGIGMFAFMFVWYNQNIWMQTPWDVIKGELIDLLVAWGLCGLWLGWWLNRRKKTNTAYTTNAYTAKTY
ncbi:MAG: hypothetical protein WKF91_11755 [Segetibacter sp.]